MNSVPETEKRERSCENDRPPQVIVAESAGFCFGVRRAVTAVEDLIAQGRQHVYTLGPIIHNEQVVEELEQKGVFAVESPEALAGKPGATVVIRSHGIGRAEEERLRALGVTVADATCPFVKKIHRIAQETAELGRTLVIVGDASHPEVQGIRGWCGGPCIVVGSEEETEGIPDNEKITIVSQTTFSEKKLKKIVEKLKRKCYDCRALNTICNATQERQKEAEKIAATVDAMIVLGGKNSSNTQKLVSLCEAVCPHTIYAQTVLDLADYDFYGLLSVGITAGASTPTKIIREVQNYVGRKF